MNRVSLDSLCSTVSVTARRSVYHLGTTGVSKMQNLRELRLPWKQGAQGRLLSVGFSCRFLLHVSIPFTFLELEGKKKKMVCPRSS